MGTDDSLCVKVEIDVCCLTLGNKSRIRRIFKPARSLPLEQKRARGVRSSPYSSSRDRFALRLSRVLLKGEAAHSPPSPRRVWMPVETCFRN